MANKFPTKTTINLCWQSKTGTSVQMLKPFSLILCIRILCSQFTYCICLRACIFLLEISIHTFLDEKSFLVLPSRKKYRPMHRLHELMFQFAWNTSQKYWFMVYDVSLLTRPIYNIFSLHSHSCVNKNKKNKIENRERIHNWIRSISLFL